LLKKLQSKNGLSEYTVKYVFEEISKQSDQSKKTSQDKIMKNLTLTKNIVENIKQFNFKQLVLVYLMQKNPLEEINDSELCKIFSSLDPGIQRVLYNDKNRKFWPPKERK